MLVGIWVGIAVGAGGMLAVGAGIVGTCVGTAVGTGGRVGAISILAGEQALANMASANKSEKIAVFFIIVKVFSCKLSFYAIAIDLELFFSYKLFSSCWWPIRDLCQKAL